MDGVHDLGGTDGTGPIIQGDDDPGSEPYFHEEWEELVFALVQQTMGQGLYNVDEFRHAIERMSPAHYLDSPYYEHWLHGMEDRLVEHDVISEEELQSRLEEIKAAGNSEELIPERENKEFTEEMIALIEAGVSTERDPAEPEFSQGDSIKVKKMNTKGHTRCPQYVRRAQGVIDDVRGTFVLPDTNAHGKGECPEPVYSVRFESHELWSEEIAEENETIYIDLSERYLETV